MRIHIVSRLGCVLLGTGLLLSSQPGQAASPLFDYQTRQTSARMTASVVDLQHATPVVEQPVVKRDAEDRTVDSPTDPMYQPACLPEFTRPDFYPIECSFTQTNPYFFPLDCILTDPQWMPDFCDGPPTNPNWYPICQTNPAFDPFCITDPMYDSACIPADTPDLPGNLFLAQNHPNPFNPETVIQFSLPATVEIHLAVYDLTGREVALLAKGLQERGTHQLRFDGSAMPSGVYFYNLVTPTAVLSRKMILLK